LDKARESERVRVRQLIDARWVNWHKKSPSAREFFHAIERAIFGMANRKWSA
jgi:hypothetical protein